MERVYLAVKFYPDHRNRDLVSQISDAFESCRFETVCVARDFERWGESPFQPDELMRISLGAIEECSAVVVEFSVKGVGLGIEAGYAAARDIPVFVIHQSGTHVSETLRGIAQGVYSYSDSAALAEAVDRVATQIGN